MGDYLGYLMVPKSTHHCLYKRELEGDLTIEEEKSMWPQRGRLE